MTDQVTPPTQGTPATPPAPTGVFEQLVGEGKKFGSPEDLAKGKMESDRFINKLTQENEQLRELIKTIEQKDKEMEARAAILNQLNGNPEPQDPQPRAPTQQPQAKGLTEADVARLIEEVNQSKVANANLQSVDQALVKQFGAEAPNVVKAKAAELGISVDDLKALASKSPGAFYQMVGVDTASSGNSSSMYVGSKPGAQPQGEPVRNAAYYEGLKQKMGIKAFAFDKRLQVQMFKDMERLGDSF